MFARTTVAALCLAAVCSADGEASRKRRTVISLFEMDERTSAVEKYFVPTTEVEPKLEAVSIALADVEASLSAKLAETISGLTSEQIEKKADLETLISEMQADVADVVTKAQADQAEVKASITEYVTEELGKLTEEVHEKLGKYQAKQSWANYTWDPKYESNYELVAVARAPTNTQNGHAKRIMYKVKFNVNNPGFWYPNRQELKEACTKLSNDLQDIDGVDRALKPACDVDWACDGDSVRLGGSYLSNCGCGSRPRQRQCVGMETDFLGGAVMYNRQNSWHGCHLLRHDGRNCHHHWAHCYSNSGVQAEHTICTSSNGNWQVPPKGWCDPRDSGKCYN